MNQKNKNYQSQQLRGVKSPNEKEQKRKLSSVKRVPVSHVTNKSRPVSGKPAKKPKKTQDDEVLAVIRDQRNGYTYYVSVIDNFQYNGISYVVMYNYKGQDFDKVVPEILIMRSYRDRHKQYFTSIHDKKEMDLVFDVFYDRFRQSI